MFVDKIGYGLCYTIVYLKVDFIFSFWSFEIRSFISDVCYLHVYMYRILIFHVCRDIGYGLCYTIVYLKVDFIFFFWSFEISEGILRIQRINISLDSFYDQRFINLVPFGL